MSTGDAPRARMSETITVPSPIIHGLSPEQMFGDCGPEFAAILPNAQLITIANAARDP
jgi:hypothetical protein